MARKNEPEPAVYSSMGLQALCQRLQSAATCSILELGPVRSANVEFWSQFNPSLYIADLRSSLPLPVLPSEDLEFVAPDWKSLLELPDARTYDVILAWDLFNYLELPAVSSLIEYLRRYCRPGAVLFALIFDEKQMPAKITVYQIADESHLKYHRIGSELCPCPRHQPRALAGVLTRFRIADSFRLRNGVVEYLFEYEGEKSH